MRVGQGCGIIIVMKRIHFSDSGYASKVALIFLCLFMALPVYAKKPGKTQSALETPGNQGNGQNSNSSENQRIYIFRNSTNQPATYTVQNKHVKPVTSGKSGKKGLPPGLQKKYDAGGIGALPPPWQERVRSGEVDPD